MNREQQSTKKEQPTPLWRSNHIVKKDFILIPAFIIFQSFIPIIIVFGTLGVTAMLTQHAPPEWFYNLSLSISFVLAQFLVLFLFFAIHKRYIADIARRQFYFAKKHVNRIVIVVMIVFVLMLLIEWLVQFLPLSLNYNATQYERRVEGLFLHPIAIGFTFISMVILRPMVEALIYRHLVIHELGKKLNKKLAIAVSIVAEALVHVYDMASVLELIPYLLIASGATYIYVKSGENLASSYIFQASIQLLIFIEMLYKHFVL